MYECGLYDWLFPCAWIKPRALSHGHHGVMRDRDGLSSPPTNQRFGIVWLTGITRGWALYRTFTRPWDSTRLARIILFPILYIILEVTCILKRHRVTIAQRCFNAGSTSWLPIANHCSSAKWYTLSELSLFYLRWLARRNHLPFVYRVKNGL